MTLKPTKKKKRSPKNPVTPCQCEFSNFPLLIPFDEVRARYKRDLFLEQQVHVVNPQRDQLAVRPINVQ